MPITLSLPVMFALTAILAGLLCLLFGVILGWREVVRQSANMRHEMLAQMTPQLAAHRHEIETLLSAHHDQRQTGEAALQQDLSAIRADLEWLAGERMIEQALTLFRQGAPVKEISAELGLPIETVRTLTMLRAH